jgi:DNA-binding response OmpR family regulator
MPEMAERKKILSVAKTDFLRRTRHIALRKAGYVVESALDFNDIARLSETGTFDVAVVGYAFEPDVTRAIAEVIRKYFPQIPIVELTREHADIPESISSSQQPSKLIATVRAILGTKKAKKTRNSS